MNVKHEHLIDEIVLNQGAQTLGRAADNDIIVHDEAVSMHHAKIMTFFGASYIQDLDSTNGTYVNGKPVRQHILHPGDVVYTGMHGFRVVAAKN